MKGPVGAAGSVLGILYWAAAAAAANTSTNFLPIYAATPDTSEYKSAHVVSAAATLTQLRASSFIALGAGDSVTLTLRKNGVDTGLTCTIAASGTSASATGSVSVVAGDILTVKSVQSGTGTASVWGLSVAVAP